jgi:hypothetical protein
VDLEVLRNISPSRDSDFLKPPPGKTLTVFAAKPHKLQVGDSVQVQLCLLAGPGGGRPVVETVEPLAEKGET